MKRPSASTIVVITANRVMRAEPTAGGLEFKSAARPPGEGFTAAVRSALALGKAAGTVWVLGEQVFTQRVTLNPAQIAGLSASQLERALAFEVEPFSGIPMGEGIIGFHDEGGGVFSVVEMPRMERDAIVAAVTAAGGKLAGIVHAADVPATDDAAQTWLENWISRLDAGGLPVITPAAAAPSPSRFLYAGVALTAAALAVVFLLLGWYAQQRKTLATQSAEFAAAASELAAVTGSTQALAKEQATLEQGNANREHVVTRRGAILALLKAVATHRSDEVVVREIKAEGASGLLMSGLALEAGAVDELGLVLTQSLRGVGWSVQPRHKTGTNRLPNGGPWEFSLIVSHWEDTRTDELLQAPPLSE